MEKLFAHVIIESFTHLAGLVKTIQSKENYSNYSYKTRVFLFFWVVFYFVVNVKRQIIVDRLTSQLSKLTFVLLIEKKIREG